MEEDGAVLLLKFLIQMIGRQSTDFSQFFYGNHGMQMDVVDAGSKRLGNGKFRALCIVVWCNKWEFCAFEFDWMPHNPI